MQSEHGVRSRRTMVQKSLSVVTVKLTDLDQLEDLLDGLNFDLVGTVHFET